MIGKNWLRSLRRSLLTAPVRNPASKSPFRRIQPRLEALEDRAVPAALTSFLTAEHVDINIGYDSGSNSWTLEPNDDDNAIAYAPEDVVLYTGIHTPVMQPSGYEFIGAGTGNSAFVLPQSQNPELLYLGFAGYGADPSDFDRYNPSAESLGRVSGLGRWLKVSLVDVQHTTAAGLPGTGKFSVWQSELEGPNVFMSSFNDGIANPNGSGLDTTDGISGNDALWVLASGHTHYNFGFTEAGRYAVTFKMSGYLEDGNTTSLGQAVESEPFTVYFSVGNVGRVQFGSATTLVNEQAGYRSITVNRVGGSDGEIKINYATSDGTGTVADGDYVATSGTLVFADGETEKVITVQVANNAVGTPEANETFNLTLSVPAPLVPGDTGNLNSYLIDTTGVGLLGTIPTTAVTINDTPTITGIVTQTTTIGTATAPIAFTIGDAETAAGDLVLSATSSNLQLVPVGNIVFGGSGASRTVTVTPVAGLSGTSRIYIIATDANGAEVTANFSLQVGNATAGTALAITASTPANSVPNVVLGADDSFTLHYTTTSTGWVTNVTFVEHDNALLIGAHGTGTTNDLRTQPASGGTARSLRIRGRDNSTRVGEYGTATITLGFTGTGAPTNTHTFDLRVNPRAGADNNLLGIPGTTSTFDVLANDAKPLAGHTFTITAVAGASNGTLAIAPDGKTLRYTPTNLATGFDRFTYTVTVGSSDAFNGYTFTGQAYVKIGGYVVVDSPTASQHIDLDFDFVGGEWIQRIRTDAVVNGSVESGNFGPSLFDADEGVLFFDPSTKQARNAHPSLDVLGVPAGADVWVGPASSGGNKLYLGIANESTSGIDAYTPVGDPRATFNAMWVRTDLVGFSGPGNFAAFNGSEVAFDTFDGLNSQTDATAGGNVSDTFWGFAGSHAHPTWYFTAPGRYELTFRSTVRVGGVFISSPDTTFTFDVDTISGNARLRENPPLARNDTATVAEDSGPATINVLANDSSSPDPLELFTVTSVTQGNHGGTVAIGAGGANVTYTPAANFFGIETFTYTITDEHGGTATATVTVTVNALPDNPAATADAYVVSPGNAVRGNVLFNDTDADGDPLTAVLGTGPAHGTLNLNANGSFTYTPNGTFTGSDSFTYTASDGALSSTLTTVAITAAGFQDFEAIITEGHTDIGIAYEGGWDLHVHDEENDLEYEPGEVLIAVGPAALTTRPSGSQFDFIGVAAGESYYQIPDSEIAGVPFLGFGLEEIDAGTFVGNILTLSLLSVNGPGQFSVWRNESGIPTPIFTTSNGITGLDSVTFSTGDHEHYNWSFSAPGRYEITVQATGTLQGETAPTTSGPVTYYFSVNNLGQIQLASATASVSEGSSTNVFITRTGGSDGPLTVNYGPTGGTAMAADYSGASGSVTFADGETSKTITISGAPDALVEGPETVVVTLTAPLDSPTVLGGLTAATVTIADATTPLQVSQVLVNGGAAQRSNVQTIGIQFNRSANIATLIGDSTITNAVRVYTQAGALVSLAANRYQWNAGTNTLTIDLTTDGFGGSGVSMLADGRFQLRLDTALITTAGNPTFNRLQDTDGTADGIHRFAFHKLLGDSDGDGDVDTSDLQRFLAAMNTTTPANLAAFDFDGNGSINASDYNQIRTRLGRRV